MQKGRCVDLCSENFVNDGNRVCVEQVSVTKEIDFKLKLENFDEKIRTKMYVLASFLKEESPFQVSELIYESFFVHFELHKMIDGNKDPNLKGIKVMEILREKSSNSSNSILFVLESEKSLEDSYYILEGTFSEIKSVQDRNQILLRQKMANLKIENTPSSEYSFY